MGTVPSVDPCLTLTGGIFTFRMKLTLLILPLLIGVAWGITADISPYVFRIKRAPQDVQPNTKIFTSNSQVNSAAAGALFGSLLSYGQNQVFNPCTEAEHQHQVLWRQQQLGYIRGRHSSWIRSFPAGNNLPWRMWLIYDVFI